MTGREGRGEQPCFPAGRRERTLAAFNVIHNGKKGWLGWGPIVPSPRGSTVMSGSVRLL